MRNVQVGQGVRAVLATEEQFADVVRFCSNPEEYGIFGIDVTYSIGDFYVTTTTYEHLALIDKATGNHPVFPGPMMVHTDEKQETFHYFFDKDIKLSSLSLFKKKMKQHFIKDY